MGYRTSMELQETLMELQDVDSAVRPTYEHDRERPRLRDNSLVKILVVDDDRAVRDALRRALTLGGYEVQAAEDGAQALDMVADALPDAVVLDLGLPGIDGLEVCRRLRQLENRVPILILTARDAVSDRIEGLDEGADDYLVKPFDVGELKARLRALLRRTAVEASENGEGEEGEQLAFAGVQLDSARHGAVVEVQDAERGGDDPEGGGGEAVGRERGGEFVELTRTEYQLLELFMLNPRRVLSHSLIYDRVWGYDFGPASNALRVYIGYLRRKLLQAGAPDLIHTVRGVGYVLREP
jgi:two-component system response regulator MprA